MNCRMNLSPNGECSLPYRCGKKRVTCCGMCKEVERCGKRCIWLGGGAPKRAEEAYEGVTGPGRDDR